MKRLRIACMFVLVILGGIIVNKAVTDNYRRTALEHGLRSARSIALSVYNYSSANNGCLFDPDRTKLNVSGNRFGWRATSMAYLDASLVPSFDAIRSMPAGVFNLVEPHRKSTSIYAIVGINTAFAAEHRCRAEVLPDSILLFISGGVSDQAWFEADDVESEELSNQNPVGRVVGEMLPGVTITIFRDGQVWAVKSTTPCDVFQKCAEVVSETESTKRRLVLSQFRIE